MDRLKECLITVTPFDLYVLEHVYKRNAESLFLSPRKGALEANDAIRRMMSEKQEN